MNKVELRRSLLKQRRQMAPERWRQSSDRLCGNLAAAELFQQARTILAYFSIRQEPDLSPLFTHATLSSLKTWGFPRCVSDSLSWHSWSPADPLPLQTGNLGIPEPHPEASQLHADEVDLILVPAVACDRRGYRLGYGGGFYDRLLSAPEWRTVPTLGIVFEFAHLTALPADSWDQPLDGVCTEVGFSSIESKNKMEADTPPPLILSSSILSDPETN
jgi:5-formyltetrahydrofolate cyclo-ligase